MSLLVEIKRDAFICHLTDREAPVSVPVPPAAISDLEVRDETALATAMQAVFGKKPAKPTIPAVLVLSDDACFYKRVTGGETADLKEKFAAEVPFSRVATVVIRTKDSTIFVATNTELYETVSRLLKEMGYPVTMVVPRAALTQIGIGQEVSIDRTVAKRIIDARQQLQPMEFPCDQSQPEITDTEKTGEGGKKAVLSKGWIIFLGLAGLYVVAMAIFFLLRR